MDAEGITMKTDDTNDPKQPEPASDLVVGSVLFAIFIVFMTVWMYLRLPG